MKKILSAVLIVMAYSMGYANPTSWGDVEDISTVGADVKSPQVTVDTNGRTVVIWVENGAIVTRTATRNLTPPPIVNWNPIIGTPPTQLSPNGSSPRAICKKDDGSVVAIWVDTTTNQLVSKRMDPLGVWDVAESPPISPAGENAAVPDLAIDELGNVVVVWAAETPILLTVTIKSSTTLAGPLSWTAPDTLGPGNQLADLPMPKISCMSGNCVSVWHGDGTGALLDGNTIQSSKKNTILGVWDVPQIISTIGTRATTPAVFVDSTGTGHADWIEFTYNAGIFSNELVIKKSVPAGSSVWSAPQQVTDVGMSDPNTLYNQILVDVFTYLGSPETIPLIGCTESPYGTDYQAISLTWRFLDNDWSEELPFNFSSPFSKELNMAMDGGANLYSIVTDQNPITQTRDIAVSQSQINSPDAGMWVDRKVLASYPLASVPNSPKVDTALGPIIVSPPTQTTYAAGVWVNDNGAGVVSIECSIGNGSTPLPVTNFTATPVGGPPTNAIQLSWTPLEIPRVFQIYRNSMFLKDVDGTTTSYLDSNRPCYESGNYAIAGVNFDSSESAIRTATYSATCPVPP